MKKISSIISGAILLISLHANAAFIQFDPTAQSVQVNEVVFIDVYYARDGSAHLALFDLLVNFDSAVLDLQQVNYGTQLGNPGLSITNPPNSANAFEVSLLGAGDFDLFGLQQTDPFLLFSLEFRALSAANDSIVSLTPNSAQGASPAFVDANNNELTVDLDSPQALVTVLPVQVSEPAGIASVMMLALGAFVCRRKLNAQKRL